MKKAIGVFDSGLGGLTVVKELLRKLPSEDIVYFGDTARLPYGTKSERVITEFSFQNTEFLLKHKIKLLVVACNTASSMSLAKLKKRYKLPIIGVIEPGVKAAAGATRNKRIGVIGTEGTIGTGSYERALKKELKGVKVFSQPCPLFVPLTEEGWTQKDITAKVAAEYLKGLKAKKVDTLILGCTHYPLLKGIIAKVMGKNVKLIDSAKATAQEVKEVLSKKGLLNKSSLRGKHRFFVSDLHNRFVDIGKRFLGRNLSPIKQVDLGK
ncbi:MAG: glutamate racemase [bacterium]